MQLSRNTVGVRLLFGTPCSLLAAGCFNPSAPTSDADTDSAVDETMNSSEALSDSSDRDDIPLTCGNGRVDSAELCDTTATIELKCIDVGNFIGGALGCREDCRAYDVSGCIVDRCGNNALDVGEQCESGLVLSESCNSLGYDGGRLSCTVNCTFDETNCVTNLCGNGEVEDGEDCDTDEISHTCRDLGYEDGTLACSDDCTFERSTCVSTTCGNGELEDGEECEPTLTSETSCSILPDASFDSGIATCSETSCTFDTTSCGRCGNGRVEDEEECDDGNDIEDDNCTSSCERPPHCGPPNAPLVIAESGITAIAANSFAVYWTDVSGQQFEFIPGIRQPRRLARTVTANTSGLDADDSGLLAFGTIGVIYTGLPGGDAGWASVGVEVRLAALSRSYILTALNGGEIEYTDREGAYLDDEEGFVTAVDGDPTTGEFFAGIDEVVYSLIPGSLTSSTRIRAPADAIALSRDFVAWSTVYVPVAIRSRTSTGEGGIQEPVSPNATLLAVS